MKELLGIQLSPTGMRSLVETEVAEAHANGFVSTQDVIGVRQCNGHGNATTVKSYLQRDMVVHAAHAVEAFKGLQESYNYPPGTRRLTYCNEIRLPSSCSLAVGPEPSSQLQYYSGGVTTVATQREQAAAMAGGSSCEGGNSSGTPCDRKRSYSSYSSASASSLLASPLLETPSPSGDSVPPWDESFELPDFETLFEVDSSRDALGDPTLPQRSTPRYNNPCEWSAVTPDQAWEQRPVAPQQLQLKSHLSAACSSSSSSLGAASAGPVVLPAARFVVAPEVFAQHARGATPQWGTEHLHYASNRPRIPWSFDELWYLRMLITNKIAANPLVMKQVVSKCLKHMKRDPAAYPIFHRNHIINGETLRHGYRKLCTMAASERRAKGIATVKGESPLLGLTLDTVTASSNDDDDYY